MARHIITDRDGVTRWTNPNLFWLFVLLSLVIGIFAFWKTAIWKSNPLEGFYFGRFVYVSLFPKGFAFLPSQTKFPMYFRLHRTRNGKVEPLLIRPDEVEAIEIKPKADPQFTLTPDASVDTVEISSETHRVKNTEAAQWLMTNVYGGQSLNQFAGVPLTVAAILMVLTFQVLSRLTFALSKLPDEKRVRGVEFLPLPQFLRKIQIQPSVHVIQENEL